MTLSSFLKKNPLFRLAIPLMLGIVIGWYYRIELLSMAVCVALSLIAIIFGSFRHAPKWLFGAGVSLLMLSAGIYIEERKEAEMRPQWSNEKHEYSAVLIEEPVVRGSMVKALAELTLCDSLPSHSIRRSGRAYIYFPRSVEAEPLRPGSRVSFKGTVSAYINAGNPAEFDAERYYYIKGVTGFSYQRHDEWNFEGEGDFSLVSEAARVRSAVVGMYKKLLFEGDELALLSALTIGERSDFPRELKEKYSVAGASHVLALSGMHLGVFYTILITLLPLWSRRRCLIVLREIVVVLLLWAYAFVAGLSPSVVRAAVIFTLISLGRCMQRDSSGVSSLSFAAIIMLVFSPHLLFDVSFQLSFAAVFSILLLLPPLQRFFKVASMNVICRYIFNLLILSFVAQLGTLPFVWYYFGVFPLYFLITNIVVVPLAFVVMSLAVLVWLLAIVPSLQYPVAMMLKFVVWLINEFVGVIALLPGASFALPSVGVAGTFYIVLMLVMLSYALATRVGWLTLFTLCCIVCSLFVGLFLQKDYFDGNYLIVYNNRKNPLLHAVVGEESNYLVSTVPQLDAEYEYVSSQFIKRERLPQPEWVNGGFDDDNLSLNAGLLEFEGLKVRLVDSDCWRENIYVEPADIVILCRGFLGKIEELVEAYPSACLVLDASLYKHSRQRIMRECAALGIEPVDIAKVGAMMVVSANENFELIPLRGK